MNKNDLRYLKTEKIIINSFLECVDQLGFEKTHISDICQKAMISRNTFYAHYEDKYALLDFITSQLENEMMKSYKETILIDIMHNNAHKAVSWCFHEVDKNRYLIQILLKCSKEKLKTILYHVFIDHPIHTWVEDYEHNLENIKIKLNETYIFDAWVGYLEVWLNHYEEISIDEAIDFMVQLCEQPINIHLQQLLNSHNYKYFKKE